MGLLEALPLDAELGHRWNHKRVWQVYRALESDLSCRTKKRLPHRNRQPPDAPSAIDAIWSMDFMNDVLYNGRRFRTFNVLDEGVREALDIVIDTSMPSGRPHSSLGDSTPMARYRLPQAA